MSLGVAVDGGRERGVESEEAKAAVGVTAHAIEGESRAGLGGELPAARPRGILVGAIGAVAGVGVGALRLSEAVDRPTVVRILARLRQRVGGLPAGAALVTERAVSIPTPMRSSGVAVDITDLLEQNMEAIRPRNGDVRKA